jgi:hypothetical protein
VGSEYCYLNTVVTVRELRSWYASLNYRPSEVAYSDEPMGSSHFGLLGLNKSTMC